MTSTELIQFLGGKPLEELEKMTDNQLLEYFAPFLTCTRPDLAQIHKAEAKSKARSNNQEEFDMYEMAKRMAAEMGVKVNL